MTAPPGTAITEGVGVYRAGELCLCSVDIYQASTVDEVAAEVDKKWDYILASLTSNGDKLKELAHIDLLPQRTGCCPSHPNMTLISPWSPALTWKRSWITSMQSISAMACP